MVSLELPYSYASGVIITRYMSHHLEYVGILAQLLPVHHRGCQDQYIVCLPYFRWEDLTDYLARHCSSHCCRIP